MPRVSCEGRDGAPTRKGLPGKLLPACLALIQAEDGAHLEFPRDAIKTTLSSQFWSALWSGFLSSPRFYRSWHQKHRSYISDTPQGNGPERGRRLGQGPPICLSATRAPPAYRSCSSPMWSMFRGFLRSDRIRTFISRPVWRFPRFCSA